MKKIKLVIAFTALVAVIGITPVLIDTPVLASAAQEIGNGARDANVGGGPTDIGQIFRTIINVILYVLGAIAVIMIVIGGIRYVTSGGDSSSTKAAKDTILYAVIGLVVAIMAYAIVNFVVSSFA